MACLGPACSLDTKHRYRCSRLVLRFPCQQTRVKLVLLSAGGCSLTGKRKSCFYKTRRLRNVVLSWNRQVKRSWQFARRGVSWHHPLRACPGCSHQCETGSKQDGLLLLQAE